MHACSSAKEKHELPSASVNHQNKIVVHEIKDAVIEGGAFIVDVESGEELNELTADIRGKTAKFYFVDKNSNSYRYQAILGLEFGSPIGPLEISVKGCFKNAPVTDPENEKDRECETVIAKVDVKAGEFPSEKLSVPPRSVEPNKKDMVRIAKEQKVLNAAYKASADEKFWSGPVHLPANKEITSVYGSNRKYNGKVAGVHFGTDFRAPTGTPIEAALRGKVVVARNLFFTGYTAILDHGFGFFTIYAHMSKLSVKEGEMVEKGKVLGLSGATGRASGPHLHWGVKLNGAKIDPMSIVRLMNKDAG